MSKKRNILTTLFAMIAALLFLAGCRTEPICNISNHPVDAQLSQEQVKNAIMNAGKELGWVMNSKSNDLIQGTLNLRDHQAVINITYDAKDYNINYVSSKNLLHEGNDIHKQYNFWIDNLKQKIDNYLADAAAAPKKQIPPADEK